jgi:DNA-binding NarL/FixJ family response regulator
MGKAKTAASSRVMIVGQHPVLRRTLREIVEPEPDFEVVAEARDLEESVTAARTLQPDVVILDVAFASADGIDAICQACQPKEPTRVVVVGIGADREHVIHSLRAGACGYLRTQDAEDELVLALRTACREHPFLGTAIDQSDILPEFEPGTKRLTLLLVEPDEAAALDGKAALECADYHVVLARSVSAALPLARSMRPDAIILDVHLPGATPEFRFVWDVRKHHDEKVRRTPILALVSFDQGSPGSGDADAANAASQPYDYLPVQAFASKPLAPDDLVEQVRGLLAHRV